MNGGMLHFPWPLIYFPQGYDGDDVADVREVIHDWAGAKVDTHAVVHPIESTDLIIKVWGS